MQYELGMEAVRNARWDEACEAFERAYELVPRPLILFNLGGAQMEAGRLVDARRSYQRFLEDAESDARARYRSDAESAIERIDGSIARVTIRVTGRGEGDEVRLDGEALAADDVGEGVPLDPGEHVAEVARAGDVIASERFEVAERERREVVLEVSPLEGVATTDPELDIRDGRGETDGGGGIASSPWFWVAVAVLVVGGAVTAGILLSGDEAMDAYSGNLPPGGFEL